MVRNHLLHLLTAGYGGAAGGGSTSGLGLTEMPIDRGAGLLGVEGALRGTNCRFESRICNEGEPALEPAPTRQSRSGINPIRLLSRVG